MYDTQTEAEQQTIAGKNAAIIAIQNKMGRCPYYETYEILDDVLIQKPSWGGKDVPENTVRISAIANNDYMQFAKSQNVLSGQPFSYYQELYEAFLISPKPVLTEPNRYIQILKSFVTLRTAFLDEKNAMIARIRDRGKNLDLIYPIEGSNRIKQLEKYRIQNEPLLKELKEDSDFSWQNLIAFTTAQMSFVQKNMIESEIKFLVEQHPIWKEFGAHIPGFGTMTCAIFMAKLQDPRRFPASANVRSFCGIGLRNGTTQKRRRGETANYDHMMKSLLCEILPDSFMKTSASKPDEPYARFFQECRAHQLKKAVEITDDQIHTHFKTMGEEVLDIVRLGWEDVEGGKKKFLGYKIMTDKSKGKSDTKADEFVKESDKVVGGYKHFLNPGHVLQRAKRQWASTFISDFYHAWLFLVGENPRVDGNPRIMAVFEKSQKSNMN